MRWSWRRPRQKPIVIADTQDNSGAGGDSDTTGMLRALVRNKAQRAAIGVLCDPESARAAHAAGEGATVTLALGGKSGISGDAPYKETFVVEKLSDGNFVAPGPFYGGRTMKMGPSACLRIGDVRVVVASHKAQLADQAMYRYVGIEPTAAGDPGQQELGAFPRRLRADRREASDLRRARRDARRSRGVAVAAPSPGHPHQAERPGIHTRNEIPLNRIGQHADHRPH